MPGHMLKWLTSFLCWWLIFMNYSWFHSPTWSITFKIKVSVMIIGKILHDQEVLYFGIQFPCTQVSLIFVRCNFSLFIVLTKWPQSIFNLWKTAAACISFIVWFYYTKLCNKYLQRITCKINNQAVINTVMMHYITFWLILLVNVKAAG